MKEKTIKKDEGEMRKKDEKDDENEDLIRMQMRDCI